MPDGLAAVLALPELAPLALLSIFVGVVYGFAGFGSALIFIPVASALVPPAQAILIMALFGLGSILTVLPRAWAEAERPQVLMMLAAALLLLPGGTWLLKVADPAPIRWAISAVVALTLGALIAGWRYRADPSSGARLAVGGAAGLLGGATGLTGPAVILFYLSGPGSTAATRANTIVFLTLLGAAILPGLALQGLITPAGLWLGLLLVPLYMAGNYAGQAMFSPSRDRLYRRIAYGLIALALVAGLPLWS